MESKSRLNINFSYYIAGSVNMMSMIAGMGYGWSSPCVPKLLGELGPENNPLAQPATISEVSWITALHSLGAIAGPLLTGIIASKLGKKKTLLLFGIPQIVSQIILIFATSVTHFYLSRFLLGIGTGCVFSLIPVYVAEISDAKYRGRTSMFLPLLITITQDIVFVIGPYVTIRSLALLSLIPSVFFYITFSIFMPDSPYDFVKHSKLDKAENALIKSRQTTEVKEELDGIIAFVNENNENFKLREALFSKAAYKSFFIAFGLMFFQQFDGVGAIGSYQQTIFNASESSIPSDISVMIVGAAQLLTLFFVTNLVDRWGRKKLLYASYVGQIISLFSLGIYFHLQNKNVDIGFLFWLPITSVMLFMLSYKLGAGPMSWTVAGEIFPSNVKFILSPLIAISMTMMSFLVTFVFPNFTDIFGYELAFWIFLAIVLFSIPFIWLVVPETKGKSLAEIQLIFEKQK